GLGNCFRRYCDRHECGKPLRYALPAGRRRGRLLSGRDVLSRVLVPAPIPHAHPRLVPGGDTPFGARGWADFRTAAPDGRLPWPGRLEVDVHHGELAGGPHRVFYVAHAPE